MAHISYGVSIYLKETLNETESLRHQILLTPLPAKVEHRLQWEALIHRSYWSTSFGDATVKKTDIVRMFTERRKKRLRVSEHAVVNFRKAFDFIRNEWLVTTRPVQPSTLLILHTLCYPQNPDFRGNQQSFRKLEAAVNTLLDLLQTREDHPLVQAAIAHLQLLTLAPFGADSEGLARIATYLFLYRRGYDARGLLVLEEHWRRTLTDYRRAVSQAAKDGNANQWLEYFVGGVKEHAKKLVDLVSAPRFSLDIPVSYFELNDRQKSILELLEPPQAIISNRQVQRRFTVSQITASRDLTKLATLGLIAPRGKGRSVTYTRV
jgi:hypothetical protein